MLKFCRIPSYFVFIAVFLVGCQNLGTKEGMGTVIGGAVGTIGGTVFSDNQWVASAATLAGALIGNQIGRHMDEQDRQRMAAATASTMATGKPHKWANPDTNTRGEVRIVATTTKATPVKVRVLKKKVSRVPPLDIIGEPYRSKNNVNVRGGPGTDYETVGKLSPSEVINVVGQVRGKDWYLISQDGTGSGFVYSPLMESAPGELSVSNNDTVNGGDTVEVQVADAVQCRTLEQSFAKADGNSYAEKITACKGPTGWTTVDG